MKKTNVLWTFLLVLWMGALSSLADVLVIAHSSLADDSISARELRDVFLGNRTRLSGGAVTPVLLREGAAHEAFLSSYVGRTPVQFQTHWRNIVFTGRGRALASFESEADLVEYVAGTTGAIGYISSSTPHEGAKVLTVR